MLNLESIRKIFPVKTLTMKEANAELPNPLTASDVVLVAITENKGITPAELCDVSGYSDSTVSRITKELSEAKVIVKAYFNSGLSNGKNVAFSLI